MRAELRELLRLRSLAPTLAAAHERLALMLLVFGIPMIAASRGGD